MGRIWRRSRIAPLAERARIATSPGDIFFGTAARKPKRNVPSVVSKKKMARCDSLRRKRGAIRTIRQIRPIRPIRVQDLLMRPCTPRLRDDSNTLNELGEVNECHESLRAPREFVLVRARTTFSLWNFRSGGERSFPSVISRKKKARGATLHRKRGAVRTVRPNRPNSRPDDPASATVILMRAKRAEDLLLVKTGSSGCFATIRMTS